MLGRAVRSGLNYNVFVADEIWEVFTVLLGIWCRYGGDKDDILVRYAKDKLVKIVVLCVKNYVFNITLLASRIYSKKMHHNQWIYVHSK